MNELRKGKLSPSQQILLSELMEENFPEIIGWGSLVDHWKIETNPSDIYAGLVGVYEINGKFKQCYFSMYTNATITDVVAHYDHTGWDRIQT